MKLQSLLFPLVCALLVTACGPADNEQDNNTATVDNAMRNDTGATSNITNNSAVSISTLDSIDQNFAVEAATSNMAEVQMANLALQNVSNDRIKAYANMMIQDHQKATQELQAIAPNKGLTIPTQPKPEHRQQMEMLKGKTGTAFEKAYMQHMVEAHKVDINEFEKAAANAKDSSIKNFAARQLPVLRMHLDSAQAISKMKM